MEESNPQNEEFLISDTAVGLRLDAYLTSILDQTRSQIRNLIDSNHVFVDKKVVKAGYKLKAGEVVSVTIFKPDELVLKAKNIDIDFIYRDNELAVINKPAGLVVHPGAGNMDNTLVHALLYHCQELSSIGGEARPGIVHRLDKDTTGLMVIAKNDQIHQHLAAQIKAHKVQRHYVTLAHGKFKEFHGEINAPIGRNPKDRKCMAIVATGRSAVTKFVVKENLGRRYSLVECRLETGRTHQIRVHMAAINHPVVGDPIYGLQHHNLGCKRQMLHSFFLGFSHPKLGWMEFQADPPQDFLDAVERARKG